MHKLEQFTTYTIFAVLIACLGSFLFGYQTAVISGALPFIAKDFSLSVIEQGVVVSILLLGAFFGVLIAGPLSDQYGRKKAILLPALLFTVGTAFASFGHTIPQFLVGRFITGLAVGLISMAAPLYLAEIAPSRFRGAFVCVHQLIVTIGILSAYSAGYFLSDEGSWRTMIGLGLVPSVLQLVIMLFFCESPHWLLSKGHKEKAMESLKKLRKDLLWYDYVKSSSQVATPPHEAKWSAIFKPGIRRVLILGLLINMFQQITGINTVIYFAPKIFQQAGFATVNDAIFASMGMGIINVLVTALSIWLLDRAGRRILLLVGLFGMAASLLLFCSAIFLHWQSLGMMSVISLTAYVAFFAIGIGPVSVVLVSEIFPTRIRGRAMGIATSANWFFNYFMSLIFLDLMDLMGSGGVFCLYAVLSVIAGLFVYFYIPETKGKTFEEIEKSFQ